MIRQIEYKDGTVFIDGEANATLTRCVLTMAAVQGQGIQETCNMLNNLLQTFDDTLKTLKEMAEELKNLFGVSEDICESCMCRRTRHGIKRAEKPRTSKYFLKWSEKYRPP